MEPRTDDREPMEQVLYEVKKVIVGPGPAPRTARRSRCSRVVTSWSRACPVWPRPWRSRPWPTRSVASSTASSSRPTSCPPTSSAPAIYNQRSGEFTTSLGPVFTNLLLADEINRAPAKVQSALLEVMQERQVTIGRETHSVPDPFLVMATQNPIESEGTYPLPEAQVDRFMLKVLVSYPTPDRGVRDRRAHDRRAGDRAQGARDRPARRLPTRQLTGVYVDPALIEYAVRLVTATREPASCRSRQTSRTTCCTARARAPRSTSSSRRGRWRSSAAATTRCPRTSRDLALDVMRHRLVLSYEALADGVTPDEILHQVLLTVSHPEVPLDDRTGSLDAAASRSRPG